MVTGNYICFAHYKNSNLPDTPVERIAIVHFYEDKEHVEILLKRNFVTVKKTDIQFDTWE